MGRSTRRFTAALLLLAAIALAFLYSRSLSRAPGASAESAGPDRLQALASQVESHPSTISVTAALLSDLMEQDVAGHGPALARIRTVKGDADATQAENVIRAPYRARMREMSDAGVAAVDQPVSVVTVGGRLSFSAISFDGALKPKDPVSIVFFDKGQAENVYQHLTACATLPCQGAFKDQDGSADSSGLQSCNAQTQWVLMASGSAPLQWRRSVRGVEDANGACSNGVRDHMRLFQEMDDPEYGAWMVGTPHRENWEGNGHVVKSWAAANQAVLDAWPVAAGAASVLTTPDRWVRCYIHTDGLYQGVEFDGKTAIVDVH